MYSDNNYIMAILPTVALAPLAPLKPISGVPEVRITVRDEYFDGFVPQLFIRSPENYYKQNGHLGTIDFTPHAANPVELSDPGWFILLPQQVQKIYKKKLGKIDYTPHAANYDELSDPGWRLFIQEPVGPDLV
jgi:hypothetical protein